MKQIHYMQYFTCSEVNNFDFEAHIVEMKW